MRIESGEAKRPTFVDAIRQNTWPQEKEKDQASFPRITSAIQPSSVTRSSNPELGIGLVRSEVFPPTTPSLASKAASPEAVSVTTRSFSVSWVGGGGRL